MVIYPQKNSVKQANGDYWKISGKRSIVWDVSTGKMLPHSDNIEMAGQKVAGIIYYTVDKNRQLHIERDIIYPQLRIFNKTTDPDWKIYRAYFRHTYRDDVLPVITHRMKTLIPGPVDSVEIEGKLTFYHQPVQGISIQRTLLPSMTERLFVEIWEIKNVSGENQELQIGNTLFETREQGYKGIYILRAYSDADADLILKAGESYCFSVNFEAGINDEPLGDVSYSMVESQRDSFLSAMKENLVLETPDEILNTLFYFSKIRAAENIFDTKMGLVHSPGGSNYYCGIWANDQAEYSGPFFPFLGYKEGIVAAYNCYRKFLENIPGDYSPITSSFEIEGELTCCGKDRGDAAMIAYGASQYALLRGDNNLAVEIWPLIDWCLEYCHRMRNPAGVIKSGTDEMEGRIPTGDANLATSSLYYGGLRFAAHLANEIGDPGAAKLYNARAEELAISIENYFGARIEGLETYRYFDGNEHLRHWICLPLVVGIDTRKAATVDALLNKLWTENGVLVELNPGPDQSGTFWDRGTLYALRGTFKAGAADESLDKLVSFSGKRLLGDHVPYVIEAWPENNMRHLSAESALYCRIFIEGLLGFEQTGFRSFTLTPQVPGKWENYSIEKLHFGDTVLTVKIEKMKDKIHVTVSELGRDIFDKYVAPGKVLSIDF
jgi:hypothetical protein